MVRNRRRDRVAKPATLLAAYCLLTICGPTASAQRAINVNGFLQAAPFAAPAAVPRGQSGQNADFKLKNEMAGMDERLEEFQRLTKNGEWEESFKVLEFISGKEGSGFVDRGDGVMVSARGLARRLLAGLPEEGREAYRLFHDARATALWERASGKNEAEALGTIVDNFIVSSVGDAAADRLGDLRFERGDMSGAIAAWRSLLECCPESEIPASQTYVKIATALARRGSWDQFEAVRQTVLDQFAAAEVTVAGGATTASEAIEALASRERNTASDDDVVRAPPDFALPTASEPLWRFDFHSRIQPGAHLPFQVRDRFGRYRTNDLQIPTAVDDERVYVNVLGVEMAFDLLSGKLLWRTGKLHELQTQQLQQGVTPEQFKIAVHDSTLWSVTRDVGQRNLLVGYSLVTRDPETGTEVFNTQRTLREWNVLSSPSMADDQLPGASPWEPESQTERLMLGAELPKKELRFDGGFTDAGDRLRLNGHAAIVDGRLRLTNGGSKQAATAFARHPMSVAAFTTQFDFQLTKAFADGITFIVQGTGDRALGSNGQGLGYQGIGKSVAVKFDLYEDADSMGLFVDGASPRGGNSVSFRQSKIDLRSGHKFRVSMRYADARLEVTITDLQTQARFSQQYTVDIPALVGSPVGFVGFGASTGQMTAVQEIVNWTYLPQRSKSPLVQRVAYVAAGRTNQGRDVAVLAIDAGTGRLLRTIELGSHTVDQNQVYAERAATPTLLVHRDRLYVDTHGGALVSIIRSTGDIEWAINYDSPSPQANHFYGYDTPRRETSGPLLAGGLLFAKGMRSTRLLGIDSVGPRLEWNRPVQRTAAIVGADAERIYLSDGELTAYDLQTQELLWATQMPPAVDWSQPLLTDTRLYQFTSRGVVEVDKHTGKILQIFRGSDLHAPGGMLYVTPDVLLTVSNLGITAYAR